MSFVLAMFNSELSKPSLGLGPILHQATKLFYNKLYFINKRFVLQPARKKCLNSKILVIKARRSIDSFSIKKNVKFFNITFFTTYLRHVFLFLHF